MRCLQTWSEIKSELSLQLPSIAVANSHWLSPKTRRSKPWHSFKLPDTSSSKLSLPRCSECASFIIRILCVVQLHMKTPSFHPLSAQLLKQVSVRITRTKQNRRRWKMSNKTEKFRARLLAQDPEDPPAHNKNNNKIIHLCLNGDFRIKFRIWIDPNHSRPPFWNRGELRVFS